jgi:hypothetical protein
MSKTWPLLDNLSWSRLFLIPRPPWNMSETQFPRQRRCPWNERSLRISLKQSRLNMPGKMDVFKTPFPMVCSFIFRFWILILIGQRGWIHIRFGEDKNHRLKWLNMEFDLQSLFGLHVHSCTHWLSPRNSPSHPHLGSYTRALFGQPR